MIVLSDERIGFWRSALGAEMAVIRMYEVALPRVMNKEARRALQTLIRESKGHAKDFTDLLVSEFAVSRGSEPLSSRELTKFLDEGLAEEVGMEDLYRSFAGDLPEGHAKATLLRIADDELRHQELLKKVSSAMMEEQD